MAKKEVPIKFTAIDNTKKAFNAVSKGIKGIGGAAAGAAKVVGGIGLAFAGVTAAITIATKKQLDYIDAIGKTARRTGLSTELLQAFQQGAIEAGSSIESAQKGLEKFARSVGDASRGLKTQADIFQDLGIEIFNTDGSIRDLNDILFDTADGLNALGSEAERATVLANLFGRSGTQFQEIFMGGADGLREFIKQGKELGFILDASGIKTVEKFNDRVSQITASMRGLSTQIVVALSPALLSIADGVRKFVIEQAALAGGFDQLGKSIALSIIEGMRVSVAAVGELINALNNLTQIDKFFQNLFIMLAKIRGFKIEYVPFEELIKVEKLDAFFDGLAGKIQNSEFASESFFNGMGASLTNLQSPLDAFVTQIENVRQNLETATVATMKKFEDTLIDGLKNGKLAFKDFANFVVEQLLRIAIQKAIIAPITGGFEDFLGNIFGKKALGGSVKPGTPYLVGESGRELFIPGEKGQIVSNNDLNKMGQAGSTPTVNFNISTVDAAGFDELLASRKGLITAIINNAMNSKGRMGVV